MPQSIPPPSDVPQSRLFESWGQTMLILRWPVLFACAALTAFMAHHAREGLVVDTRTEAFLPEGSEAQLALKELRREFGAARRVQVLVKGDVFTEDFLGRLRELHESLADLQVPRSPADLPDPFAPRQDVAERWADSPVVSVTSLINIGHLHRDARGVGYAPLPRASSDAASLAALRREILEDSRLAGRVVDAEGRHAILRVELAELPSGVLRGVLERIEDVAHAYEVRGFEPAVGGGLAIQSAVYESVLADQDFLISAEAVALLLMMWLVFRHPMGVLGPLLVVGQAATCMFGWMTLAGVELTMISAVLGALVLATGMGFSIHLQSAYRRCRAEGFINERAVVRAVASSGAPVLFTAMVSSAAMLSFGFADMEPIREWGLAAAAGIFFSGLFALTFMPAWLALNRRSRLGLRLGAPSRRGTWHRIVRAFNRLSRRSPWRRRAVLALGLVSAGIFAFYASRVRLQHDPTAWLPPSLPEVQATRALGQLGVGSTRLHLVVRPLGDRDSLDPEVLRGLDHLVKGARAFRDPSRTGEQARLVRGGQSLLDLMADADRALEVGPGGAPPRIRGHAVDLVTLWQHVAPDALRRWLSLDRALTRVQLQVAWGDVESYAALTQHLGRLIERDLSGLAEVELAGHAYNTFTVARALLGDLMRSFLAAFSVVGVLLLLLHRDLKLALIALVPTVWPFLGMLGFMGLTGRGLDIQSVLLAAIAMGFGVDNAIHFLHHFRVHYAGYGDVNEAVAFAFEQKGPAMLGTSAVLGTGFAVLLLGYMGSTRSFGLLAVVLVALGLLANLLFMPALLRAMFRSRPRAYDPQRASSYDLSLSEFS